MMASISLATKLQPGNFSDIIITQIRDEKTGFVVAMKIRTGKIPRVKVLHTSKGHHVSVSRACTVQRARIVPGEER